MRITYVGVDGLFGVFKHDIDFKLTDRITIIHGPNGYGKTIILKMIDGLLTGNYSVFYTIPFSEFKVNFDDGRKVVIRPSNEPVVRPPHPKNRRIPRVRQSASCTITEPDGKKEEFELTSNIGKINENQMYEIDRALPTEMQYLGDGIWYNRLDGSSWTVQEVLTRWRSTLRRAVPNLLGYLSNAQASPLQHIAKSIHVHLIRTERLSAEPEPTETPRFREEAAMSRNSVERYSQDLVTRIAKLLGDYARKAAELDRTFPERLLTETEKYTPIPTHALKMRFEAIEKQRANLIALGFLEREKSGLRGIPESLYETQHNVLSVYVADMEEKLSAFAEMATKVGLLTKIINDRFTYKTMHVTRERGFVFASKLGELSPNDLSSGEQHELVLLYELLFKVDRTWLVMLDEPEISLHVAWQKKFLGDLQSIVKLSNVDVLIATHSPSIIGRHWDALTVELQGPRDETYEAEEESGEVQ